MASAGMLALTYATYNMAISQNFGGAGRGATGNETGNGGINGTTPGCPSLGSADLNRLLGGEGGPAPGCFCDRDPEVLLAELGDSTADNGAPADRDAPVAVVCFNLTGLESLGAASRAVLASGARLSSVTINGSQLEDGSFDGDFFRQLGATPERFAVRFCNNDGSNRSLNFGENFFANAKTDLLKSLVIVDCALSYKGGLPDNIKHLKNLEQLHLQKVGLTKLESDDLIGLNKLQILDLHDNDISLIPADTFKEAKNLRVLSLGSNSLNESFFDALTSQGLDRLTILDLSGNLVSSLRGRPFARLPELDTLLLTRNLLTEIPRDAFSGAPNLKQLFLDSNLINATDFPTRHSLPAGLTVLNLADNFITQFPNFSAVELPHLEALILSGNEFDTVPAGNLAGLRQLFTLRLEGNNRLCSLEPGAFRGLPGLRILSLRAANLTRFDSRQLFDPAAPLAYLSLAQNPLGLGDGLVGGSLGHLTNLSALDLAGAALTRLPAGSLDGPRRLHRLVLAPNDFRCDDRGETTYLTGWLRANLDDARAAAQFRRGEAPVCATPDELVGLPLMLLSPRPIRSKRFAA